MRVPYSKRPFIVFIDRDGRRLEQIDLWEVDAPSYHEAMVAAADIVQLYVGGEFKLYEVTKITFCPTTGYTFVSVEPIPDKRSPVLDDPELATEVEGQMSIEDL